jgi:hypothetical protein
VAAQVGVVRTAKTCGSPYVIQTIIQTGGGPWVIQTDEVDVVPLPARRVYKGIEGTI